MVLSSRLISTIADALGIPPGEIDDALEFEAIEQWDSMGHVALITALEAEYDLSIEDDDVVELTSVKAIREFVESQRG